MKYQVQGHSDFEWQDICAFTYAGSILDVNWMSHRRICGLAVPASSLVSVSIESWERRRVRNFNRIMGEEKGQEFQYSHGRGEGSGI